VSRQTRQGAGRSAGVVRILIADNQAILVDGMRLLLEQQGNFKVVDVATDGADAVHIAKRLRPDVAILSNDMTGLNGIEAAHQMRAVSPATRVLILSRHSSPEYICQALQTGAAGYLLTQCCGGKEIVDAVIQAMRGESYLCARTSELLIGEIRNLIRGLTARERDALRLALEGRTSAKSAKLLKVAAKTVDSYRSRALRKLEIHGVPGAVLQRACGASLARALCGCMS
jgi:DNA-binding NarL/FixJ family response regulator